MELHLTPPEYYCNLDIERFHCSSPHNTDSLACVDQVQAEDWEETEFVNDILIDCSNGLLVFVNSKTDNIAHDATNQK